MNRPTRDRAVSRPNLDTKKNRTKRANLRERVFWHFSGNSRLSHHRMVVVPSLSIEREVELWRGIVIRNRAPVTVRIKQAPKIEDMPWSHSQPPVVSDELRRVLIKREKKLQFLPTQLVGRAARKVEKVYWILNALRIVSCHDERKTEFTDVGGGRQIITAFALSPRRVARGVHVFRVRHLETCLVISDELKQDILTAQLTGCQFFDPNTPVPLW